jgi:MFS family permease
MTLLLLAWGIIWRMTLWGLAAGSVLGLLYGCALIFLVGGVYGVLFGAVFGLVTGLLSGVVMAVITLATPLRTRRTSRFSKVLRVVPIVVILALAMLQVIATIASDPFGPPASGLMEFLTQAWSRLSNGGWQIFIYYIPSIIGTVPAWFAGKQVASWVADESWRPRQPLPSLSKLRS